MRDNRMTYRTWAPEGVRWTQWVKPILFAEPPFHTNVEMTTPDVRWAGFASHNTMVVIDLPGKQGVEEALALAGVGYRPVPLYNGVKGPHPPSCLVQVEDIVRALYRGADVLASIPLRNDAPPAFLLDANRMQGYGAQPGEYDNRWCVFPQDMPSAAYLQDHGIQNIILRSAMVQDDLSHILYRYQEKGMRVALCDGQRVTGPIAVSKPSRFKSSLYRFKVASGLRRNAAGGFGAVVPEPTQSSGGRHYYGGG